MKDEFVIGYDVGTGGCKAVLATAAGELVVSEFEPYEVNFPAEHQAEQDPEDWWKAVSATTRRMIEGSGTDPADVGGIAFASQMLGVLPVGETGTPLCPGIIWMDSRASKQAERLVRRMGGRHVLMRLVGVVPSGKDVLCKMKWVEEEQPDTYKHTYAFLDVKGYLLHRATGLLLTDQTAASVTGYMDTRTRGWSPLTARILGGDLGRMPEVRKSTDVAGGLTEEAAVDLGLLPGTPVVMGMGDAPAAAIGAGTLEHGESVISIGTSGLVLITISKKVNLGRYGMASIAAADDAHWILAAEIITAGSCLKWFKEQLVGADELARARDEGRDVYQVLDDVVTQVPPGARRLLFTPWMYGERAPITDTNLRGGFLNVSIDHTRADMLRAVYEGVAFNYRWCFEAAATKHLPCPTVRAIGGGAMSDSWMQIFADVTGRTMESVAYAQEAGAMGAALAVPVALGIYDDYAEIKQHVKVRKTFEPDPANRAMYDELFVQFKRLYDRLAPVYRALNSVKS